MALETGFFGNAAFIVITVTLRTGSPALSNDQAAVKVILGCGHPVLGVAAGAALMAAVTGDFTVPASIVGSMAFGAIF